MLKAEVYDIYRGISMYHAANADGCFNTESNLMCLVFENRNNEADKIAWKSRKLGKADKDEDEGQSF